MSADRLDVPGYFFRRLAEAHARELIRELDEEYLFDGESRDLNGNEVLRMRNGSTLALHEGIGVGVIRGSRFTWIDDAMEESPPSSPGGRERG